MSGDERPYEVECLLRKNGSPFFVEICGKNITYHGNTVRVAAIRDITERKRTAALIQQFNERLQTASRLLIVQEEERQSAGTGTA